MPPTLPMASVHGYLERVVMDSSYDKGISVESIQGWWCIKGCVGEHDSYYITIISICELPAQNLILTLIITR